MPELPEVETIARELRPLVEGRTILDAWFDWPRQIKHPSPEDFAKHIRGRQILSIDRRAKWIVVSLTGQQGAESVGDEAVLAIQVKMTGFLHVVSPQEPADKHVHFRFVLDDGNELRMRDPRKFGRMGLYKRDEAGTVLGAGEASELFAAFGPEPLDDTFTLADFRKRIRRRKGRLKSLLMDQGFVAGVGNIYADEALWRARLHPLRSGAGLEFCPGARLVHLVARGPQRGDRAPRLVGRFVSRARRCRQHAAFPERLRPHGSAVSALRPADHGASSLARGARTSVRGDQRLPQRERTPSTDKLLAGMR